MSQPRPLRRRPGRMRRWVVRPFVWGLVLLLAVLMGCLLLLQSRLARERVLARLVAASSEFLGRRIEIGEVDYALFPPALEVYDVVVPGPRPGDPPVARIPFASLQIALRDLRGRVFDLEEITVERPEVFFQFNPDGTDNLPRFRFRKRRGPRRFDVRIGHILVQDGTLRINHRRLPFSLDARSVWGRLTGRAERNGEGGNRLDALVTAQEVTTTLPRANPYRFTLSVRGSILPEQKRIRIATARFAGPDLLGRTDGFIDYLSKSRRIELGFAAEGALQILNRLGYMEEGIAGAFTAEGRFVYQAGRGGQDWSYTGRARSPRVETLNRVAENVVAAFTGDRDDLKVDVEGSRYAGGSVTGLVSVDTRGSGRDGVPVFLDLDYQDLSMRTLIADQFPGEEFPIVSGLAGRAGGTLEYRFLHTAPLAGTGRADVRVKGDQGGLPIAGDLPILLDRGVISSGSLHLTAPGQDVTSSGFAYDTQRSSGRLDFKLVSRDLGPLAPVLRGRPVPGEEAPFWLPSAGRGRAEGTVAFARGDYTLQLLLDLQDVVAPATVAETAQGSLTLNPRALENLRLDLTRDGGALLLTGRVPLPPEGKPVAAEPFSLAVDAEQWPAAGLGYFLSPELAGVFTGRLSGRLDLGGFPERLSGRADARVRDLVVSGVPLGQAQAVVSFDGGRIEVEQGQIAMPAGLVVARGSFDQATDALDLVVSGPGLSLQAEPFRRYLGGSLTGRVTVEATASGTLSQPHAMVSVRGRELVLQGRPLGKPEQETTVQATWDGQHVDVLGSLLGLASFQGGGRLDRQGADLEVELRSDQLGVLAGAFSPQPLPELTGSLVGTLALGAAFEAGDYRALLQLADLRLQYQGRTIASREPAVVELTPQAVAVRSLYLAEPGTENELFASGTIGLGGESPLDLRFQSTVSASWAALFLPRDFQVEGSLDLLGALRGTASSPLLSGQGEVRGGRLIVPNFAQAFADVHGFLSFNRDRITLDELYARLGNGSLKMDGYLVLPRAGQAVSYELQAQADNVSVRLPEFLLNRGDATLTLVSNGDEGRLIRGDVFLDRILYVEDVPVDLLAFIRSAFQRQRLELAETDDFQATTQLNLAVHGEDALRVRNNVANLQGDVRLAVNGTLARPAISGEVGIEPGGTLVFNDNEYEVQRGSLTFNPNRIDPVVDLVAQTEVQGFNITLNLGGTLERPDINFASDANLADLEIVSLIATGQRPTEGPVQDLPADEELAPTLVARQFLYGQAASAISKRVGNIFPFDRFRIDPVVEAGQPISGVGVTVGKRLSREVFVTYSTEPSTNRQYLVQVEWQVRSNVTLVLTQAGDGSYAVDAQLQRRF